MKICRIVKHPSGCFSIEYNLLCYSLLMNKVDLTKLFNKVFTVEELKANTNPNFVNIRHDESDIARASKYALKTKSDRIKKQTV